MNKVFWLIVAVDAALFLVLLIATLLQSGPSDGGKEMALTFGVVLPAVVIGSAVLLYVFSTSTTWRTLALVIVAGPGLLLAGIHLRDFYINYQIAQKSAGRGYFSGSAMKDMGQAVVSRDLATLRRLAPKVNLNEIGERGMTLVRLAVTTAGTLAPDGKELSPEVSVVRTLISLGAKPDPALEEATKLENPEILKLLLEAGADPNSEVSGSGVVFAWLRILPVENLRLLVQHGTGVNSRDQYGSPLLLRAAEEENWDAVIFLIHQGADVRLADKSGKTLSSLIEDRLSDSARYGSQVDPGLLKVKALMTSGRKQSQD